MANDNLGQPLRWYQRFSSVMLVGVAVSVVVFILLVVGFAGYYYWQIRSGNGQILFDKFYGNFTADIKNNNSVGKINRTDLEISNAPFLGSSNPQVTIVEFIDFKCPNSKMAAPILRQVLQKYGNKVKLIVRNFPVESTRKGTNQLSMIAMCAYEQGYYWPLHDWLYEQQGNLGESLSDTAIDSLAFQFGWEASKMKTCLSNQNVKVTVNKDFGDGYQFGVAGTPTFFINGEKVEGVIPFSAWELFLNNVK